MIELKNITKQYNEKRVLDNITITLKEGNIYCIKGISGSGKSTLLNIISCIDSDYSGEYIINNKNILSLSDNERDIFKNKIGYMMQKNLFYKSLTINENLLMVDKNQKKINLLSHKLGVFELLRKKPNQISGGELQRFALIRTLLSNNKIIILDEPTSNLDSENSQSFASFLKKLDIKDKIIIIATHKNIFDDISNAILKISFGKIKIEKDKTETNKESNLFQAEDIKKNNIFSYVFKLKHNQNIITQLFITILLLAIFVSFSLYLKFSEQYIYKLNKSFPYNVVDITNKEALQKIKQIYDVTNVYEDYQYINDNQKYYYYLPEDLSSIRSENFIYGHFPKNNNGIMINESYANAYFQGKKLEELIGSNLVIENEEYIISAIISNSNKDNVYAKNILYYDIISPGGDIEPAIFLNYDKIKEIGEIKSHTILISINKNEILKLYEENEDNQNNFGSSNAYYTNLNQIEKTLKNIESILITSLIAIIMFIFLSIVFIINQLFLQMFYRKKEIAFLQLLHFKKDEISTLFSFEYLISFIFNFIISTIMYFSLLLYINYHYELNLFLNIKLYLLLFSIVVLVFYIITDIPIQQYLKKDIKELIK